jgi:hypothetical protein
MRIRPIAAEARRVNGGERFGFASSYLSWRHLSLNRHERSEDSLRFPNIWKLPLLSAADNSSSSFRLL